jgi:hypothetical protein
MMKPTPNPRKIAHHVCLGKNKRDSADPVWNQPQLVRLEQANKLRRLFLSLAVIKRNSKFSCKVLIKAATSTSPREIDEGKYALVTYS